MTNTMLGLDAMCAAVNIDPLERGLQIIDAAHLAQQHFPSIDPDRPAFVVQLQSRTIAGGCKRALLILYPPEHLVTRVDATDGKPSIKTKLAELDRADDFESATLLYVPPLAQPSSLNALGQVVARLRAPDGCPWDRAQTHHSLRKDFLEECYEVLETLDQNDIPHLQEELGDLLLHILLQTQIAAESGEFRLTDVVADIAAKLVRRHPHVFGDVKVSGTDEIIANWERIKETENGGAKLKSKMPRGLPALTRAQKIAKRGKLKVRSGELAASVVKLSRARNREKVLGEILFALAAYASAKGIDAESALRMEIARRID
jgi:tetrapyrrole methylase family protein/MazG family protein